MFRVYVWVGTQACLLPLVGGCSAFDCVGVSCVRRGKGGLCVWGCPQMCIRGQVWLMVVWSWGVWRGGCCVVHHLPKSLQHLTVAYPAAVQFRAAPLPPLRAVESDQFAHLQFSAPVVQVHNFSSATPLLSTNTLSPDLKQRSATRKYYISNIQDLKYKCILQSQINI